MISNIFAFGAWVFQQFSFPTMANVFCLNGGPARAPICRRVPQDAPQRRPKTPPICPKTSPRRPKKPQEASIPQCRWFLGPKKGTSNIYKFLQDFQYFRSRGVGFPTIFVSDDGKCFLLLNGGPARAPICRRVPQDVPQRRPKTPPRSPKRHTKRDVGGFLDPEWKS